MTSPHLISVLAIVALLPSCDGNNASKTTEAKRKSAVVARVNGAPIYANDVSALLARGLSRKEALDALIEQQLLFDEARRRGLHKGARQPLRKAMVRELIYRDFAKGLSKDKLPMDFVKRAYRNNIRRFVRPELVRVFHIVAIARKFHPPMIHQKAEKLAKQMLQMLQKQAKPLDEAKMRSIVEKVRAKAAPVRLVAEPLTTKRHGQSAERFAKAAFALKNKGDITPVVRTRFGFHIILLEQRIPARNRSLASVEGEIRDRIFDESRRLLFERYARAIEQRYAATAHPNKLTAKATSR
jgi:peptidyl-prolyl cis-trans isomerase C